MIRMTSKGSFQNAEKFLNRMSRGDIFAALDSYAGQGTAALAAATPVDSGASAHSWTHEVQKSGSSYSIIWKNTHTAGGGPPVVILLQFGHGTGTGGYVQGRDFINPAIRPVFDKIAADVWKEVTK